MFPTGNLVDEIDVPNIGRLKATLINAGIPTVFLNAADLGYTGKSCRTTSTTMPPRWKI